MEEGVSGGESSGDDEDGSRTREERMPTPRENGQPFEPPVEEDQEAAGDARTRVLSVLELEDLLFQVAPDLTSTAFTLFG